MSVLVLGIEPPTWQLVYFRVFGSPTRNFCIWFNENFSENCQKSIFIEFSWVSVSMRRLRRLVYIIAVCRPADFVFHNFMFYDVKPIHIAHFFWFESFYKMSITYPVQRIQVWQLSCGENSTARSRPSATFWVSGAPLTGISALDIIVYDTPSPNLHISVSGGLHAGPYRPHCAYRNSLKMEICIQRRCNWLRAQVITLTLLMYHICPIYGTQMLRMSIDAWEYPQLDTAPTLRWVIFRRVLSSPEVPEVGS